MADSISPGIPKVWYVDFIVVRKIYYKGKFGHLVKLQLKLVNIYFGIVLEFNAQGIHWEWHVEKSLIQVYCSVRDWKVWSLFYVRHVRDASAASCLDLSAVVRRRKESEAELSASVDWSCLSLMGFSSYVGPTCQWHQSKCGRLSADACKTDVCLHELERA